MLAQLKAQLKQQAAENIQLEDMLKQADTQMSSAPVQLRPRLSTRTACETCSGRSETAQADKETSVAQDMQMTSSSYEMT